MKEILYDVRRVLSDELLRLWIGAATVIVLSVTTIAVSLAVFVVMRVGQAITQ